MPEKYIIQIENNIIRTVIWMYIIFDDVLKNEACKLKKEKKT